MVIDLETYRNKKTEKDILDKEHEKIFLDLLNLLVCELDFYNLEETHRTKLIDNIYSSIRYFERRIRVER